MTDEQMMHWAEAGAELRLVEIDAERRRLLEQPREADLGKAFAPTASSSTPTSTRSRTRSSCASGTRCWRSR
jgi:hypothetical protein